ncbi:hypothetical protein WJX72_007720 [[Myrmecia] bisecta]|uniref:Uncharacterized protein n=1 Tax=[Myrmecia] bisecta TaxID=41462 RepID=A0AAW1Q0H3_9CHLO
MCQGLARARPRSLFVHGKGRWIPEDRTCEIGVTVTGTSRVSLFKFSQIWTRKELLKELRKAHGPGVLQSSDGSGLRATGSVVEPGQYKFCPSSPPTGLRKLIKPLAVAGAVGVALVFANAVLVSVSAHNEAPEGQRQVYAWRQEEEEPSPWYTPQLGWRDLEEAVQRHNRIEYSSTGPMMQLPVAAAPLMLTRTSSLPALKV